jgi:hypothetical protein
VRSGRLPLTAALVAGWMAYGAVWALISLQRGDVTPVFALRHNLWLLVPTMLTTLAVPGLARRLRIAPGHVRSGLAIHVALACAFATAQCALSWQLGIIRPPTPVFGLLAFRYFVRDAVAYLLVAAVVHARDFWQLWREEQVHAARTRAALARAAVDALCWRVQPGLILKALDRVDGTLAANPAAAEEALARLGDLLRRLLQDPDRGMVSVANDVGVLEAAVATVAGRGALAASVDEEARSAALPRHFLLALVHETLVRDGAGIRLDARRAGETLSLSVAAVPPLAPAAIEAARARLEATWPERVRHDPISDGVRFLVPVAAA